MGAERPEDKIIVRSPDNVKGGSANDYKVATYEGYESIKPNLPFRILYVQLALSDPADHERGVKVPPNDQLTFFPALSIPSS